MRGGVIAAHSSLAGTVLLSKCLCVLTERLKCHGDRQTSKRLPTHRALEILIYPANSTQPERTKGRRERIKSMGEAKKEEE